MNLLELSEPLFLKACELNRMGRSGKSQDFLEVRAAIKGIFDDMKDRSASDTKLAGQFKKMELPLLFFIDSMIVCSRLKCRDQWNQNRLAAELYNILAGDDQFFDMLEETLNESTDEATERLAVFFVCLGLGFVGSLGNRPDQLRKYSNSILPRIKPLMDVEYRSRLVPDAYFSDNRVLELANNRMGLILVLFIFFVLSFLVAYYGMYLNASSELSEAIKSILKHEPGA